MKISQFFHRTEGFLSVVLLAGSIFVGCRDDPSSMPRGKGKGLAGTAPMCSDGADANGDCVDHTVLQRVQQLAKTVQWVVVADVATDSAYFSLRPDRFTCGIGELTYTKTYVPFKTFAPLEWWKAGKVGFTSLVLEGDCLVGEGQCESPYGSFPMMPGRYLLFVTSDCCVAQYSSGGGRLLYAIPVDSTSILAGAENTQLSAARAAVKAVPDEPTKFDGDIPLFEGDFPCIGVSSQPPAEDRGI